MFQDDVNNKFLINLRYMLRLSPENADSHFDTCLSTSYNEFRHYPNHWACKKGLNMISKTRVWGYLE